MNSKTMILLIAAGLLLSIGVQAQEAAGQPDSGSMEGMSGMKGKMDPTAMKERCQAMMAKKEEMKAHMATMDENLDELVAQMNAADDATKTDAVAAVVTELVAQKKARQKMMMKMQQGGMKHMMHHRGGEIGEMKGCPMMEKMSMEDQSPDVQAVDADSTDEDHSEHH